MLIIPVPGFCKSLSDVTISASCLSWCFVFLCAWIFDSDVFMLLCGNLKPRIKVHSSTEDFLYWLGPCAYSTTSLRSQGNKFTLIMCIWKVNLWRASRWLQFLMDVIVLPQFTVTIKCQIYLCLYVLLMQVSSLLGISSSFVCLFV